MRLRLADRETTVQLNANGIGKSAQSRLRSTHPDAAGVARGGRLDCELVFSGADGLGRPSSPVSGSPPDPVRTFRLELEIASTRHSAAILPVSRVVDR